MAPRCRFGAFVYTVGPWAWVVGGLGIAIVYTNGRIGPLRAVSGRLCTLLGLLRCCGQMRGRKSVHKLARMTSRCRFGAFVYTVAPWTWVVGGLGIAIVYTDRRKRPLGAISGRLCTLVRRESRYESRREQPASGGTSASAAMACRRYLLAAPSRLVGKTGSERVAPLPSWRLRRGVNPHEPLKSLRLRQVKGPVSTDKTHPYAADCGT